MAYRKSSFVYNREIDKTGVTTYDDVYNILQDNIDQLSEFYEIEPASTNLETLTITASPHSLTVQLNHHLRLLQRLE